MSNYYISIIKYYNLYVVTITCSYLVSIRCCPLSRDGRIPPFILQLLALCRSTLLDSGHPPSSNQSSLSPPPLASSRSSLVILASLATHFKIQSNPKALLSSFLSTCLYHLTPFTVANQSIVFYNPNMSTCSSVVLLTTHGSSHSSLSVFLKNCFFILF